jgi:large subunit ribosomal protein L17
MRHKIAGNKLGRNQSLRKATIRDVAKATILQERILTTEAKAKEGRKMVDKLITLGKKGTLAHKRRAFAILCDHKIVSDLFSKTSPRFNNRKGGYTRIIPLGNRRGDNAKLVFLELTEKTEVIISKPKSTDAGKVTKENEPKEGVESSLETSSKKEPTKKKSSEKEEKGSVAPTEKSTKGKKITSGIRKMFNKKSTGK